MNSGSVLFDSPAVLVYGSDDLLLETRTLVLKQAGLRVFAATEPADAEKIITREKVVLMVLCHSLSADKCEAALELAETRNPHLDTLVLTAGGYGCHEKRSTAVLSAFDGPRMLVRTVQDLLASKQVGSGAGD